MKGDEGVTFVIMISENQKYFFLTELVLIINFQFLKISI